MAQGPLHSLRYRTCLDNNSNDLRQTYKTVLDHWNESFSYFFPDKLEKLNMNGITICSKVMLLMCVLKKVHFTVTDT